MPKEIGEAVFLLGRKFYDFFSEMKNLGVCLPFDVVRGSVVMSPGSMEHLVASV